MPKKAAVNAFFLFRSEVRNQLKSEGKHLTEDELTKYAGDLWEV